MKQFDLDQYNSKIKAGQSYLCNGCLDWSDISSNGGPSPHISVDSNRLMRKAELRFPDGECPDDINLNMEIGIAVPGPGWNPLENCGSMPRYSCDEEVQIILVGMYLAVTKKTSESNRKKWGKVRKKLVYRFRILTEKETKHGLTVFNHQMRENLGDAADLVLWSPLQRVEFIQSEKVRVAGILSKPYTTVTAHQVFQSVGKIRCSGTRDQYKEALVSASITVADKLFTVPLARETIQKLADVAAENGEVYFNSVYQLQLLVYACKSSIDAIQWVMKTLLKSAIDGELLAEKLSQRNITATCHYFLMQKQFLVWVKSWLIKHEFIEVDTIMKKLECASPGQWFTKDTIWQGQLGSESSMEAALWIYDVVFTKKWQSQMMTTIHNGHSILQFVETPSMKEKQNKLLEKCQADDSKTPSTLVAPPIGDSLDPDGSTKKNVLVAPKIVDEAAAAAWEQKKSLPVADQGTVDMMVETFMKRYFQIEVYPTDIDSFEMEVARMIRESSIGNGDPGFGGTWVALLDTKVMTMAKTNRLSRPSGMPMQLWKMLANACLVARAKNQEEMTNPTLQKGDCICIFDAGRTQPIRLLRPWCGSLELQSDKTPKRNRNSSKTKDKKGSDNDGDDLVAVDEVDDEEPKETPQHIAHAKVTVSCTEAGYRSRCDRIKGLVFGQIKCHEVLHVLSREMEIPHVDCTFFPGHIKLY